MRTPTAAGWHGKIPTLGDFATRRLDVGFVEAWDHWLSVGLQSLRSRVDWLEAYLASPSWRFVLMPGALPGMQGQFAWAGVLMPSVDRVGRYYPLTLVQPLDALPVAAVEIDALWRWLLLLDDCAADALHDDWTIERLEEELTRIGAAPITATQAVPWLDDDSPLATLPLGSLASAPAALALQAAVVWQRGMRGRALWASGGEPGKPRLLTSRGLEPGRLVAQLFGPVDDNA